MKFREISKRKDIQSVASKTVEAFDITFLEFVDYVSKKVNDEGKETIFYQDPKMSYAYFEEEDTLYIYFITDSDEPISESSSMKMSKEKPKVNKSNLFTNGLLILLLVIGTLIPSNVHAAGYFNGTMEEDATVYEGLAKAKFTTPSGSVMLPGFLSTVKSKVYQDTAFSYTNPNRINNQPSVTLDSLAKGSNENLLLAILAYRQKFKLEEISSSTGINVTQRQLDEATQLAVWLHASQVQVNYQIDANSITDTTVRSMATEITTWATQQVNSLTSGTSMGNYLFPLYKPVLDTSKAKIEKTEQYIEYGPYTVSGQKSSKFLYGMLGGVLLNSSKKELNEVTANEQFFARFPISYTGDKIIRLKGQQYEYSLNHGKDRLWLDKYVKPVEVQFTVGSTTGTTGLIQVTATDSFTGKKVQGVGVEISTTSPITTIQTNDKGEGQYNATVGTYKLKFTVPEGYIIPPEQEIKISFAGDIQLINLDLNWSRAIVNFHAVDAQTLTSAGDSEAFIYDAEGKAVKRVGITQGKVEGVVLPEGEYTIIQYKASGGYGINTGTPFKALAGKVTEVSINQDPNVLPTTISIEGASSADSWVYTLSTESKVLFKLNGNNTLTIPLPSSKYSIMAQKSNGSITAGPLNFSTVLNGKTDVKLEQVKGEEVVTFSLVDTIKKEPIPNIVVGLFDEDHNLLTQKTATPQGVVTFENVMKHSIYYINILAAPETVSGYSANGNRFLGDTKEYVIELYSQKEIQEVTKMDTLYRLPNVTYTGGSYTYPTK